MHLLATGLRNRKWKFGFDHQGRAVLFAAIAQNLLHFELEQKLLKHIIKYKKVKLWVRNTVFYICIAGIIILFIFFRLI